MLWICSGRCHPDLCPVTKLQQSKKEKVQSCPCVEWDSKLPQQMCGSPQGNGLRCHAITPMNNAVMWKSVANNGEAVPWFLPLVADYPCCSIRVRNRIDGLGTKQRRGASRTKLLWMLTIEDLSDQAKEKPSRWRPGAAVSWPRLKTMQSYQCLSGWVFLHSSTGAMTTYGSSWNKNK